MLKETGAATELRRRRFNARSLIYMALPGRLCIGIIEEDNPQKSYFRFKPLIVAEGERYVAYDVADEYPESGCVRIVPDKNESSRFKARMRRMGRWCMVDLREHPDENDKIRPNKNYNNDDLENNAYIIYSDVVRELPEGTIAEIVFQDVPSDSAQLALSMPAPQTARVVFSGFEPFGTLWTHSPIANTDDGLAFSRTGTAAADGMYARFDLPGFDGQTLSFIAAVPGGTLYSDEPAPETISAQVPISEPDAPQTDTESAPAPAPAPWLYHDESIVPPPVDPRLSPREQSIAMQTGLNPRRGRSLHEIIEDKWRRSRFDQLGHPVPGAVTGQPVSTPVDNALEAVSHAWAHVNARAVLARALAGIEGLALAITGSEDRGAAENRQRQLEEYRIAREELAAEIERCRAERDSLHGEMLQQLQEANAAELAEHAERVRRLEENEAALRARADEARLIVEEAEHAVAQLTDEKLTERLSEYAVNTRAANLLVELSGSRRAPNMACSAEPIESITLPLMAKRVRAHFAANGFSITEDDAINMLACISLGGRMLFTGPSGCGKTLAARLLTEALGLVAAGRCADYTPAEGAYIPPFADDISEYPAAVIADDINARPDVCARIVDDFESLDDVKLIMTAQDSTSGLPMGLRLLDRTFMVRLKPENAESAWVGPRRHAAPPQDCITSAALKKLFSPDMRHISAQVSSRLATLRKELAGFGCLISRRTLDALWLYCASVTPYMSATPMEVFDRAFAQRAVPAILASANPEALHALPEILNGLPRSLEILQEPVAIDV